MSDFKVEVVKIDDVINHPNADRLNVIRIGGYNCISNKLPDGSARYKKDDLVVYIPEAALLPEYLMKRMDFWDETKQKGTLSGSKGNRVKAIKLRGILSQGIIYGVKTKEVNPGQFRNYIEGDMTDAVDGLWEPEENGQYRKKMLVELGDDVAESLVIEKYEPQVPVHMSGVLGSLFGYTKSYDIENIEKYMNVFTDGEQVVATEKCHGTLFTFGILKDDDIPEDKKKDLFEVAGIPCAYVSSKGLAKKGLIQKNSDENTGNLYVRIFDEYFKNTGVADNIFNDVKFLNKAKRIYVFGEVIGKGVQDLDYGLQTPALRIFDVYAEYEDGSKGYLNNLDLTNFCIAHNLQRVPVLFIGPYSKETIDKLKSGHTIAGIGAHIREGVVVRPLEERDYHGLPDNRVQLKAVSEEYLLRKDGTEYQ